MLLDKMAISHGNHLFVPVVFVFCLLSPVVWAKDSDDYTDSRQQGKNRAVSRQRNNIQWLPNYNWKPPEHYGLSEESTEEKARMEFTKPEDPEQRIADPWIKKMQEISRQKREKWVPYKRNENEKLTLDNVEETTGGNKLRNDESITLFDPILTAFAQSLMDQDSAKKNLHDPSLLQSTNTKTDELNQKHDLWDMNADNTPANYMKKKPVMLHQRNKDYEISSITEDLIDKPNASVADYERRELENDRSLTPKVNSQESKESNLQESKSQRSLNNRKVKKNSNSGENINDKNKSNSKESLAKVNSRQLDPSQNDKEKNSRSNKRRNEKTTKSFMWKTKEERDVKEKDTTRRSLNHGGSLQPGRWGMSISQPPMEFQEGIFRSTHRKNKEHTEDETDRRRLVDRSSNAASPPKKPHKNQNIMLHLTAHLGVKSPKTTQGSSNHRSFAHENHQDSQTDPTQRSIIDEHNKELAETLHEQIPKNFYHLRYPKVGNQNNYQTIDLNNYLRNLKFLVQALQSLYVKQNVDILMSYCIQIPYVLFRA